MRAAHAPTIGSGTIKKSEGAPAIPYIVQLKHHTSGANLHRTIFPPLGPNSSCGVLAGDIMFAPDKSKPGVPCSNDIVTTAFNTSQTNTATNNFNGLPADILVHFHSVAADDAFVHGQESVSYHEGFCPVNNTLTDTKLVPGDTGLCLPPVPVNDPNVSGFYKRATTNSNDGGQIKMVFVSLRQFLSWKNTGLNHGSADATLRGWMNIFTDELYFLNRPQSSPSLFVGLNNDKGNQTDAVRKLLSPPSIVESKINLQDRANVAQQLTQAKRITFVDVSEQLKDLFNDVIKTDSVLTSSSSSISSSRSLSQVSPPTIQEFEFNVTNAFERVLFGLRNNDRLLMDIDKDVNYRKYMILLRTYLHTLVADQFSNGSLPIGLAAANAVIADVGDRFVTITNTRAFSMLARYAFCKIVYPLDSGHKQYFVQLLPATNRTTC